MSHTPVQIDKVDARQGSQRQGRNTRYILGWSLGLAVLAGLGFWAYTGFAL